MPHVRWRRLAREAICRFWAKVLTVTMGVVPQGLYRLGGRRESSQAGAFGLRTLSLIIGLFLVLMGNDKVPWLSDTGPLLQELSFWRELTSGASLWYLETVAIPPCWPWP